MRRKIIFWLVLIFISHFPALMNLPGADMPLAAHEQLLWFPALATPHKDGWNVSLSGLVTEDEKSPALSWLSRWLLGFSHQELGTSERKIFRERTRRFLADDQLGKRIEVDLLSSHQKLGRTSLNGHFSETIFLPQSLLHPGFQSVPVRAWANNRLATSSVAICTFPANGISVVSDIDDTIKISQVRDRHELMRNTFLRPFRPVEGMAMVYGGWAENSGAQFHYVSGSPWQLFPALNEFIASEHFPAGSWHLRSVRLLGTSVMQLLRAPDIHKKKAIKELLERLPDRRFVFIGDSGERDPEIYGDLAREFPKRQFRIFIRNVTQQGSADERYAKAFKNLPEGSWLVFDEATQLPASLRDSR